MKSKLKEIDFILSPNGRAVGALPRVVASEFFYKQIVFRVFKKIGDVLSSDAQMLVS